MRWSLELGGSVQQCRRRPRTSARGCPAARRRCRLDRQLPVSPRSGSARLPRRPAGRLRVRPGALSAETWEDDAYAAYPPARLRASRRAQIPDAIDLGATRAPTDAPIDGTICVEVARGDDRPLFLRVQGPDPSVSVVYFAVVGDPGDAATPPGTPVVADGDADPSATTARPPLAGSPESPATVATGGVRQTTWGASGLPLADAAGQPTGWFLMAVRMAQNAVGMSTFAEVRNDTPDAAVAPSLTVEVLGGGTSFGATELIPINGWAPVGGSAYYVSDLLYADELYDGTVAFGGWDEERYGARDLGATGTRTVPGLRLEDGTVTNVGAGEEPIGGVVLVVRDRAGIFSGGCVAPGNGQLLGPGSSIPAPEPLAAGELPDCPPADRGVSASESLGLGGPFSVLVVLA